jgi:hypothetical protein
MSDDGGVKIVKVGQTAPLLKKVRERLGTTPTPSVKHTSKHRSSQPKYGVLKHGKTARAKPRFEAVRDPTSSPPVKKFTRSGRLRILTEHGSRTRRATIAKKAKGKSIHEIRTALSKSNLAVRDHTPEHLTRKIYKDAHEAGMISDE